MENIVSVNLFEFSNLFELGKQLLFILERTWSSSGSARTGWAYLRTMVPSYTCNDIFFLIHLQIHQSLRILTSQSLHFIWLFPLKLGQGQGQGQASGGKASQHGSNSMGWELGCLTWFPTTPQAGAAEDEAQGTIRGEGWKHPPPCPFCGFGVSVMLQAVPALPDSKGKMSVRARGQQWMQGSLTAFCDQESQEVESHHHCAEVRLCLPMLDS